MTSNNQCYIVIIIITKVLFDNDYFNINPLISVWSIKPSYLKAMVKIIYI